MALARYESVAVNLAGDVIPNATVEVRRDQPGRPVVPLWSDREGTVALGNPITTDSEGKFGFHVTGGVYYIRVFTGPSQQPLQQYVRRYQAIGTAAERDVEDLASALEAGTATFPTLAELEAFVPAVEGVGGKVTTGEDAGFYHYDDIGEVWVFDRPLFDSLARMNVTGGTVDAIEAETATGVADSSVVMLWIEAPGDNTGPVTINGKEVLTASGNSLIAGQWNEGRTYWFSDEGANYKLRTESDVDGIATQVEIWANETLDNKNYAEEWAQSDDPISVDAGGDGVNDKSSKAWAGEAEGSAAEAAGYAAGVNLPPIMPGDVGKQLFVNEDEDGYELSAPPEPVTDGDKGDVTVSSSGTVWEINDTEIAETGAIARPLISRFNEGRVSVFDFMTPAEIADYQSLAGALDHTAAAQAALDTGAAIVYFPEGLLSLRGSSGLTATTSGQHIQGSGPLRSYLNTPTTGTGIDLLRVAAARTRVSGMLFRPGRTTDRMMRVYAGDCEFDHNRFLAGGGGGAGTCIYLTDQDPSAVFVTGAYSHWIHHNRVGADGYNPLFFIETAGTSGGQNATIIENNHVLADRPIYIHAGGGLVIRGNLLQSATGTPALKAGRGIECDGAIGVKIYSNYIEKYEMGIRLGASSGEIFDLGNHWDNVQSRYVYASGAPKVLRVAYEADIQDMGFTANSQMRTPEPDRTRYLVFGSGGARTGCLLGPGTIDGQQITLIGGSTAVTISAGSYVRWNQGGSAVTFGSGAGEVMVMKLIWHSQVSRWWEVSRTIYA